MVTAAMPSGFLSLVPAKMTSSMRAPRRLLADCSPSTQLIASLRFDFPHPFGPTTAAMPPPLKRNSVLSQKDLKPWISTRFSFSKPLTSSARGTVNYTKRDYSKSKAMLALYTEVDPVWPPDIVVLLAQADSQADSLRDLGGGTLRQSSLSPYQIVHDLDQS